MMTDVPTLLKQYGVDAVISDKDYAPKTGAPAGLQGVEHLLGSGHKVIVQCERRDDLGPTGPGNGRERQPAG